MFGPMGNDDEVVLLWGAPDYAAWAAAEQGQHGGAISEWKRGARQLATGWDRILLANAPLCPFRTGRQPRRSDRTDWAE